MGERESARRAKRRGHSVVWSDRPEVAGMKIVKLANKEIDVVRGELVVLLQVIESDDWKSGWKIPPKDVNRRAGVLGGTNDMHYRSVEREGGRDVNLYNDQGVMVNSGTPLKVVESTDEKRRSSKSGI